MPPMWLGRLWVWPLIWSGKIKDNKIGICYFSAKYVSLRSKSKDWLVLNLDNIYQSRVSCLPKNSCFNELVI
jgi:hypothetical protein